MKSFIIPIQFQFNGQIQVQATSLEEANTTIQKYMHATAHIENDQDHQPTDHRSITDYKIDLKGDIQFLPINMDTLDLPS